MKSRFLRVHVEMLLELRQETDSIAEVPFNSKHIEISEALFHTLALDGAGMTGCSSTKVRFNLASNAVGERTVMGAVMRRAKGFSNYFIHRRGFVRTPNRGIKPRTNHGGYREVKLVDDAGKRRWVKVHNLVLEAFVGPRPSPKHHGAHLDGNKSNNAVENLAWKLPVENEADKKTHGTAPKGRVKDAKTINVSERRLIWSLVVDGRHSYTTVGKQFGIHRSTVAKIVKRVGKTMQPALTAALMAAAAERKT